MALLTDNDEHLIKAFEKAGLVPSGCRRIIVDIPVDDAVMLFYECFGDERLLQLNLPDRLHNATVIRARDIEVQDAPSDA